jgi:hypothetical protein
MGSQIFSRWKIDEGEKWNDVENILPLLRTKLDKIFSCVTLNKQISIDNFFCLHVFYKAMASSRRLHAYNENLFYFAFFCKRTRFEGVLERN